MWLLNVVNVLDQKVIGVRRLIIAIVMILYCNVIFKLATASQQQPHRLRLLPTLAPATAKATIFQNYMSNSLLTQPNSLTATAAITSNSSLSTAVERIGSGKRNLLGNSTSRGVNLLFCRRARLPCNPYLLLRFLFAIQHILASPPFLVLLLCDELPVNWLLAVLLCVSFNKNNCHSYTTICTIEIHCIYIYI